MKGFLLVATTLVAESGIDRHLLGVAAISSIAALVVLVAPRFSVSIARLGGAWVAIMVASTSQLAVLTCAKSSHQVCEGCHRPRLFLSELSSEPFIVDTVLKGIYCLRVRAIYYLIFLGQEPIQKFSG